MAIYPELLQQALQAIIAIDDHHRFEPLLALIPYLTGEQRHEALRQALLTIRSVDKYHRAEALIKIAKHVKGDLELEQQILQDAMAIDGSSYSADALTRLATYLTGAQRTGALQQALHATLSALVPHLTGNPGLAYLAPCLAIYPELLQQALQATIAIDDHHRFEPLLALIPYLTGEQRHEALRQALLTTRSVDKYHRAKALIKIAKHVKGDLELEQQILQDAMAIDGSSYSADALTRLATYLTGAQRTGALQQALHATQQISNVEERRERLSAIVPHLTGNHGLLQEALQVGLFIGDISNPGTPALTSLVPFLTENIELVKRILQATFASYSVWCEHLLIALAPHLTGEQWAGVRQMMLEAPADRSDLRAESLTAIIPFMRGKPRTQALQRALDDVLNLDNSDRKRDELLNALIPAMVTESELLPQALEAALAVRMRRDAFEIVAPHLKGQPELLHHALRGVLALGYCIDTVDAFKIIGAQLNGQSELLQEALQGVLHLEDPHFCRDALIVLVPYLARQPELLYQATHRILASDNDWLRREVLFEVFPHLSGESQLLNQALQAILAWISKDEMAVTSLIELIPFVARNATLVQEVLQVAQASEDAHERCETLIALLPHLTGEQRSAVLRQAVQAALNVDTGEHRVEDIIALIPFIVDQLEFLQQILQSVRTIADVDLRGRALAALVPQLADQPELLRQAVQAQESMGKEGETSGNRTAPRGQTLGEEQRIETCIQYPYPGIADALKDLLANEPGVLNDVLLRASSSTRLRYGHENHFLANLERGGRDLRSLLGAIFADLEHDYGLLRDTFLVVLAFLGNNRELLQQALQWTLAIETEWVRGNVLSHLTPYLINEADLLRQALRAVLGLSDRDRRVGCLWVVMERLASRNMLDSSRSYSIWIDLQKMIDSFDRPTILLLLPGLVPFITKLGGSTSAQETARAILDSERWWP